MIKKALIAAAIVIGLLGAAFGTWLASPAEAAPTEPTSYEVVEYNARGERVAHHGHVQANTWYDVGFERCSGRIRLGTFGDGYAEFATFDQGCHAGTGIAVQTEFFGNTPWSPAGCTFFNSMYGYANPNTCDNEPYSSGGRLIRAHLPGTAFMARVAICSGDSFQSASKLCAPARYYGIIAH
jgi:hypothetical protein